MAAVAEKQIQLKPETLGAIRTRSEKCENCRMIFQSLTNGNVLSERCGLSVEAQTRHIKLELSAFMPPKISQPLPSPIPQQAPKEAERPGKVSAWPDNLKDETVERLQRRIPKDEDSPGCQLCKWIVQALGPGNAMRNHPVNSEVKEFLVKSQKMHLALEFGETEP